MICVGGNRFDESHLRVLACANCFNVISQFLSNQPQFYEGGAYWHFRDGESFGFAPNSNIKQDNADGFDCEGSPWSNCKDSNRLSWFLDRNISGGWRLGNIHCIKYINNYVFHIFI